jgi:hypothetical protein
MHAAELFVPKPYNIELHIAIKKLKRLKSTCADQIAAELIQAGEIVCSCH